MHLTQVFQIEKDLMIVWKTSHHFTCSTSNNEISNSSAIEDMKIGVSWDSNQDISWEISQDIAWGARNIKVKVWFYTCRMICDFGSFPCKG